MFCNIGFAEMKLIESDSMSRNPGVPPLKTVCIDGYKFVISIWTDSGLTMVQFFEERDGKSLPAKC